MPDCHTGLTHDRPVVKAKIYKRGHWWTWHHNCSWKPIATNGYPHDTQANAMAHALKHMEHCW